MGCLVRLNPCDYLFHAFDHHMRRRGYPASAAFMMMEARGRLDPERIVEALRRAMDLHPVVAGRAAVSFWRARPCWRVERPLPEPHYAFHDLSGEPDWPVAADALGQERFSAAWDSATGPQVRIDHFRGPQDQHRLMVRWTHALMDAEGVQLFMTEADRLAAEPPALPHAALSPDGRAVDPLRGNGPLRRLALMIQGIRERAPAIPAWPASLCDVLPQRPVSARGLRYLHREWPPQRVQQMRAQAARLAPAGPVRYGRYLAGCIIRAIYRLHAEHGRRLPLYGVMFPMSTPDRMPRPVASNYLAAVTLIVPAERLDDRGAVQQVIHEQVRAYFEHRSNLAGWSMMKLMSGLRVGQYRRLVEHQIRTQPFATGYSYYGDIDPPLRCFLGAEVTNLWSTGVQSIPPGWNPVFSVFGPRMNLALAWPESAFPPDLVRRYLDLIEEEVFQD